MERQESNYVKRVRRQPVSRDFDGYDPFKEVVLPGDVAGICARRVRDNTSSGFTSLQELEWRDHKRMTATDGKSLFYTARKD